MKFQAKFDSRPLKRYYGELSKTGIRAAATTALNNATAKEAAKMAKFVKAKTNVKQALIRKRITRLKAKVKFMSAKHYFKTGSFRWPTIPARVLKRGTVKFHNVNYENAFFTTLPEGHKGYFQRRTNRRLPIDELRVEIKDSANRALRASELRSTGQFLVEFPKAAQKKIDRIAAKRLKSA